MEPNKQQHRLQDRTFGFVFSILFVLIFGVSWFFFDSILIWLLIVAACFFTVAVIYPVLLLPLNRLWGLLTGKLTLLLNTVVLLTAYGLVIFPIGLIMRILHRDALHRTLDKNMKSYWVKEEKKIDQENFKDMF